MSVEAFWAALRTAALLGGERRSALPAVPAELGLPAPGQAAGEAELLRLIALTAGYRRAGRLPLTPLPPPPAAAPDSTPLMTETAMAHLQRIISETQLAPLLLEWEQAALASGRLIPPRHLPPLLERARNDSHLRPLLARLGGERVHWLAAANPRWAQLIGQINAPTLQQWQEGSQEDRNAYFSHLRQTDRAAASALLAAEWRPLPARERAHLVSLLSSELDADDEPFLERCLDDRSREVRQNAIDLLARLPASAFNERFRQRLPSLLAYETQKGKGQLLFTPPTAWEAAWGRDGIVQKPLPNRGERSWWLEQLVSHIDPAAWCQHTGLSAAELLTKARASDWSKELRWGWEQAALRFQAADMAEALLRHGAKEPTLLLLLPTAQREALLLETMSKPRHAERLLGMTHLCAWSESFGRHYLKWLLPQLANPQADGHDLQPLEQQLPPSLLEEAVQALEAQQSAVTNPYQQRRVNRTLEILRFRLALHRALDPKTLP